MTLSGDAISHSDINLKLPRQAGGGGGSGGGVAGKDLYQVSFNFCKNYLPLVGLILTIIQLFGRLFWLTFYALN